MAPKPSARRRSCFLHHRPRPFVMKTASALASFAAIVAAALFVVAALPAVRAHAQVPAPAGDPIAQLDARIERGETRLDFQPGAGYLPSLLDRLGVNVDSQILVFSK